MNKKAVESMASFLESMGINLKNENMEKTPQRVVALYEALFSGRGKDTSSLWGDVFPTEYRGIVAVTGIPFYSVCEHHLMPFFGTVDIAYVAENGRVAGFSKLAKLVEIMARRPQLQERMTREIADAIEMDLSATGVMIRIEAEHFCMLMLGEVKPGTKAVTVESRGILSSSGEKREEALLLFQGGKENAKV